MNHSKSPPVKPVWLNRRRFMQGLASAACGTAGWVQADSALATGFADPSASAISLTVAPLPVNITGRARMATVANGVMPGPLLRLRQGEVLTARVTNRLAETTSIHWHGIRLPTDQDGVPGLSFRGIAPGETFTYQFPIVQSGTYWYHGHSGMQEQTGLYGPLILLPREPEPYRYDRDYVVMLSDWTDEDPMTVLSNLKQQSDYYDYQRRTLGTFVSDADRAGFKAAAADRLMWDRMRMSATDLMDVSGATYTFLVNGQSPSANWTALFAAGEKVRLRFINAASMTSFDLRIPGLSMTVIAADGTDIEPIDVDEFRIAVAETYDVIVTPGSELAYTIFAQAFDRSGYARATLAAHAGAAAAVPALDPRPLRTMSDVGMQMAAPRMDMSNMDMSKMDMSQMPMADMAAMVPPAASEPTTNADGVDPARMRGEPSVDHVAQNPQSRLGEAGTGLEGNGRRVLLYSDLRSLQPHVDQRPAEREVEFHLTGNMERWMWGFDGKKFSEAAPVRLRLGERVRFVLVNDTMMEHPIHLHGFLFALENAQNDHLPIKHTVNVKPNERLSFVFTADTPGYWAFHCHLMLHMDTGMFRTVIVA
jgi:CopA family copper-resistance protein